MNLLWCCMVAALVCISNAALDVERTVLQVQNILQTNSQLPRLSREEIIQLLNDIRAEDAKSKSSSTENSIEISTEAAKTTTPPNTNDNEVNSTQQHVEDNIVADEKEFAVSVSAPTEAPVETTTKSEPTVMVVLPYTPRDGSSLQELYTRPPRIEVVPESHVTPKPLSVKANEKLRETLRNNAQLASKQKLDIPAELQAFLDSHGLKGKPVQDHFLLPLEGFKPLPPAKVVDGTVQLPENILLQYDLISPNPDNKQTNNGGVQSLSSDNFLYEPLRPELPFELDTSSSETKKAVLPLDLPKPRATKSPATRKPNYQPVDYDSVKVIPLNKGPNPLEDERVVLENDLNKRQINISISSQASVTTGESTTTTLPPESDTKEAITNAPPTTESTKSDSQPSDTDSGASIADLEDSFGGAAPAQPGDSQLPPPRKNGFYWMVDWNSFLEVGDSDNKVNIRFEPKLGDPQMFLPVNVP